MNPIILKLGPFPMTWYGLLIVGGAVLAAWLSTKEAARRGEDPEHAWNILTWALILGIIGARLYHVFSTPAGNFAGWAYYRENPIEIIKFWEGGFKGLGIYGAVAGGVLAVILYWRWTLASLRKVRAYASQLLEELADVVPQQFSSAILAADLSTKAGVTRQRQRLSDLKKLLENAQQDAARQLSEIADRLAEQFSLKRWLDIPTPGLILAQAIGRMGNRINQELYGPPTNLPWAFHINPTYPCQEPAGSPMACGLADRLSDAARQWYAANGFHPTFYYEALWNVAGFALLWWAGRRFKSWLRDGDVFLFYLIWYPVGRFWVELFRPDAWRIGSLATAQWVALGCIVVAIVGLILNHRRPRPVVAVPEM